MAALICILGGLPKDDRVASFRFLKSTPRRYRNSKKLCTDGIARLSVPATGLVPTSSILRLVGLPSEHLLSKISSDS